MTYSGWEMNFVLPITPGSLLSASSPISRAQIKIQPNPNWSSTEFAIQVKWHICVIVSVTGLLSKEFLRRTTQDGIALRGLPTLIADWGWLIIWRTTSGTRMKKLLTANRLNFAWIEQIS